MAASDSTLLGNRYRLGEKIGQGGMGVVYHAIDTQTGDTVAIKQLQFDVVAIEPGIIQRFVREGEALRQLNHPNIVKMLAGLQEDGNHYLVMEFVSGGDLSALIKSERLSIKQALEIVLDLADALTRAHRLKIIHRDLKPANVLISEDGTPRLTDFGVAHFGGKERVTGTGVAVGTIDYLAPEALKGNDVDTRADIWAFGVMLFEMLAGRRPFVGEGAPQVLMSIVGDPTPDLEKLCPDAPVALVDLVYRMLEKDPQARIPSVRQIGAELEAIMEGIATSASRRVQKPAEMPRFDTTPFAADLPKHNLPAQTTPFVGREAELAELSKLLNNSSVRLITILAQGGMGKTRLALEIATQFAGSSDTTPTTQMRRVFPNGVYFVELAPLNAADAIAGAIAIATGYQLQNEMGDARQQVLEFLREKTLLLIMDNFEHLIDGAGIVADILHNAPHVKIIATSRQRLNQTGETLFNLAGMDFPEWETPENALEYSAVKLFMQSARRARPSFELHADDLQYVARICRMVDGLPLGILLAAAWLEMLSPKEISTEIARSLDFLESHMSDIPERQRSIRAVFDYSWNLMTPEEQVAFMQLAVFQGGFTREAAQEVAGANLRVLMSLMNKSLIRRDADSGRYDIHELLRQYAEAKLRQAGIEEQTHDAHSHYFAAFLAQREADIKGRRQLAALEEVDADFTNVRAMWQRIVTQKQGELVSAAMESLRLFCDMRGRTSEGTELFSLARENFPQDEFPLIWSLLTVCWGWMIVFGGQLNRSKVESPLYESLESLRSHQHHIGTALCLEVLGLYYFNPDTFEKSRPLFEECIAILRPLNESSLMGGPMAMLANFQSTPEDIAAVQQQSLELSRAAGNINEMAWTLMNVGMHHLVRGLLDEAEAHWHESLALHRARKARNGVVFISTILSYGAFYKGDLDTAKTMNAEVMKMSSEYMYLIGVKSTLALFALIHAINGDYERCRHDAEEALAIGNVGFESLSLPVAHIALAVSEYALNDVRATKQHYTVAYNIQFMTPYLRTSLLPICALIHSMEGAHERAVECLALAFQQPPATMGWMQKWALLEQLRADFEQKLGKEGYNAAWERGKTLDIEIVIRELAAESKS